MIKPGWKTSEFWLTAASLAIVFIVITHSRDAIERRLAVGAMPASIGVYAHGRARVKSAGAFSFIGAVAHAFLSRK